jgi:hypothetical protein
MSGLSQPGQVFICSTAICQDRLGTHGRKKSGRHIDIEAHPAINEAPLDCLRPTLHIKRHLLFLLRVCDTARQKQHINIAAAAQPTALHDSGTAAHSFRDRRPNRLDLPPAQRSCACCLQATGWESEETSRHPVKTKRHRMHLYCQFLHLVLWSAVRSLSWQLV